jgi:hypothetical protein
MSLLTEAERKRGLVTVQGKNVDHDTTAHSEQQPLVSGVSSAHGKQLN